MKMLEMKGITKHYPGTIALNDVDFYLDEGEIVSLLGENGAGKTTLMKVLYGMTKQDLGSIKFRGEFQEIKKPTDAINLGICMVHQHFMLVPAFTVTENIVLGDEPSNGVLFNREEARKQVSKLIEQFNFKIDPDALVSELSVGEQQRVEILKALYRKADVIILDEPTAVLTPSEVDELFIILKDLNKHNKTIIIITHKLKETMALASRVVVLRDGNIIADDLNPSNVTVEELSETMVGRKVNLNNNKYSNNIGDICLKVENLTIVQNNKKRLNNINLSIRKGEILGIAGIEGNGQSQLIESLTGCIHSKDAKIYLDEELLEGTVKDFLEKGVAHIPEDRLKQGLVKELSIEQNMILGYHRQPDISRKGLLKLNYIQKYANDLKTNY